MALEDGMDVGTTPTNVITALSLSDGDSVELQNTGSEAIFFIEMASEPTIGEVKPRFIDPGAGPGSTMQYDVDDANPLWVWVKSQGSSLAGSEV